MSAAIRDRAELQYTRHDFAPPTQAPSIRTKDYSGRRVEILPECLLVVTYDAYVARPGARAVVTGRMVRRDGTVSGTTRQVSFGYNRPLTEAPQWILDAVEAVTQ